MEKILSNDSCIIEEVPPTIEKILKELKMPLFLGPLIVKTQRNRSSYKKGLELGI
jgi:hypothetical protein